MRRRLTLLALSIAAAALSACSEPSGPTPKPDGDCGPVTGSGICVPGDSL
jgi:hypothetical protein